MKKQFLICINSLLAIIPMASRADDTVSSLAAFQKMEFRADKRYHLPGVDQAFTGRINFGAGKALMNATMKDGLLDGPFRATLGDGSPLSGMFHDGMGKLELTPHPVLKQLYEYTEPHGQFKALALPELITGKTLRFRNGVLQEVVNLKGGRKDGDLEWYGEVNGRAVLRRVEIYKDGNYIGVRKEAENLERPQPENSREVDSRNPAIAPPAPEEQRRQPAAQGAEGSRRLTVDEISSWNFSRVRYEINVIYARYGTIFPNQEIQSWADRQPWYRRVPGRSQEETDRYLNDIDRFNIEILAARRNALRSR